MFGAFFGKREKKPTPPWVAWLIIGVVLYAMFSAQKKGSDVNIAVERTAQNITTQISRFDQVKDKLLPIISSSIKAIETQPGEGAAAICGQEATISYNAWLSKDKPVEGETDRKLTFTIGAGKVLPALEQGVVGMAKGGKRSVYASPDLAYRAPGFVNKDVPDDASVMFDIALLDATPAVPEGKDSGYRIIDAAPQQGGDLITCGRTLRAHVEIWGVDGKKRFSTRDTKSPVEFTPGQSEVFLGLEQGVLGMVTGGERLLVVPPSFQETMRGNASPMDFKLPGKETVLVEVRALP